MKAKSATKAQKKRFTTLVDLGCIACILDKYIEPFPINAGYRPEVHHMKEGGKRMGHDDTAPLCYWHHQGLPYEGRTEKFFLENIGPSFHKHTENFRARYGDDLELIEIVNGYVGVTK